MIQLQNTHGRIRSINSGVGDPTPYTTSCIVKISTAHMFIRFIIALTIFPVLSTFAATKAEYQSASIDGLREQISFGRAQSMVKKVMTGTNEGKVHVVGRGEIMLVSQLLLAGKTNKDAELLELARDLVIACNKAALDGYDTPEQNSLEQIGFSLRELGLALPELKKLGLLTGNDASRADETLKKAADFLLKFRPDPGDGNIMQRYALGIATVCSLFPDDPRVPQWKAWAQKPFLHLLRYPNQERLPGSIRRVLSPRGERWRFSADPTPFQSIRGVDISEDSSAYLASSIMSWMGIAPLIGRAEEIKTPQVREFIDRFYQQMMPIGILPAYGDADWNGAPALWIAIFEWAGSVFHEPKYRAAADAIFRYQMAHGLPIGDLTEAVNYANENISPKGAPRQTILLERLSGRGERVPDKIILRGHATNDETRQPYVMMQCTESYGHSHPHAGSISAYTADGTVLLHTLGYDATPTMLHQSFMVRPSNEKFLPFFGDPKSTLIGKIMPDGQRLTSKLICDDREVRSAEARDVGNVALGKVVCDYLTSWHSDKEFNGYAFQHTRSLALDKTTGMLCVLDTIESKSDVQAAFGPVWHVQDVIAKNAQGFLCQSEIQAKVDGKAIRSKARPVWIAMAGPEGTRLNDVFWKFTARNGHAEIPQEHHLTAEWKSDVKVGQKFSFLTVMIPLAEGTTAPPEGLKLKLAPDSASVMFGTFNHVFPHP